MKSFLPFLFAVFCVTQLSYSQSVVNYNKLNVPSVDAAGQITDAKGVVLGVISENGFITNANGEKVAFIDAFNNTIDEKTGERMGKTDNDGNFFLVVNKKLISWKTSSPETGVQVCLVKDLQGKIVAAVHKKFKQYGSSAVYYLIPKDMPKEAKSTEQTATSTKEASIKTTSIVSTSKSAAKTKKKAKPQAKSKSKSTSKTSKKK